MEEAPSLPFLQWNREDTYVRDITYRAKEYEKEEQPEGGR